MLRLTVLIAFIISMSFCDWVEIPQSSISLNNDKFSRKSDGNSLYIYTTTTARTPILAKPTMHGKNRSKNNRINNNKNDKRKNLGAKNNVSTQNNANVKTNRVNNLNTISNRKSVEEFNHVKNIEVVDNNFEEDYLNNEENEEEQYSYASFVPYLSTIQSTLMRNAHQNKKSKVGVLTNLRDHLLYEIQNRMTSIWKPRTSKEARHQDSDSNVDFPSNEAALMTIGFLTFAVFLIKLVLKLVQAIKDKINMNNSTSTTAFLGRKRRDVLDEESIQILNYIDQYAFK